MNNLVKFLLRLLNRDIEHAPPPEHSAPQKNVAVEFHNDPEDVLIHPVVTSKQPAVELEVHRARASRTNQLKFDYDPVSEEKE